MGICMHPPPTHTHDDDDDDNNNDDDKIINLKNKAIQWMKGSLFRKWHCNNYTTMYLKMNLKTHAHAHTYHIDTHAYLKWVKDFM